MAPNTGLRPLMTLNDHQMAAGKRLKNYDEQLMLIIPVVGRYDTHMYYDRWIATKLSWTAPSWAMLDSPKKGNHSQLLDFWAQSKTISNIFKS
jgi:hypothetical protein